MGGTNAKSPVFLAQHTNHVSDGRTWRSFRLSLGASPTREGAGLNPADHRRVLFRGDPE
jgi:hypothetical protein